MNRLALLAALPLALCIFRAYTYTWSNVGQWYQTNDPEANPNGAMSGTWTKQQVVHGNGTPY